MNVFITGEVQAGKSTAIMKAADLLGASCGGFRTTFGKTRWQPDQTLYMLPVSGEEPSEALAVVQFNDKRPTALTGRFDELGPKLLKTPCELVIMDELGRFERDALLFKSAVFEALEGSVPVLGVLRNGLPGWTGEVAAHRSVRLLTLTAENRDELPELIVRLLRA